MPGGLHPAPLVDAPRHRARGASADSRRVLFVNDLWGYGTVTMAMAVAQRLDGHAACVFAGCGPGLELARKAQCFDSLLDVNTMCEPVSPELDRAIQGCQAVVTVMNGAVARRAVEHGIPCAYLDCMSWMWTEAPDVPRGVPYYAERFPGVREHLDRWRDRLPDATVVGPLVVPTRGRPSSADAVLVNFGGLSCGLVDQSTLAAYATSMTRTVLAALAEWPGRVVVAVGEHIRRLMPEAELQAMRPGVALLDLGHDAYLAELRRSRALISSAGMHALYEACALGVPFVCLPSQNLSGSLAVDVLEQMGVHEPHDWRHLYDLTGLRPLDEPGACQAIADCVRRFASDVDAQGALAGHLLAELADDRLEQARGRQVAFYRDQGRDGAQEVAERVLDLIGSHVPRPAPAGLRSRLSGLAFAMHLLRPRAPAT